MPDGLPYGFEFCITLARSLANAEAVFRPDAFSGYLVRELDAGVHDRLALWSVAHSEAAAAHVDVVVVINGTPVEIERAPWPEVGPWRSVEVICRRRLPRGAPADALGAALLAAASVSLTFVLAGLDRILVDEQLAQGELEGQPMVAPAVRYERSPVNRSLCLGHYGYACQVCGFDFGDRFGSPGEEFIEVHHLKPLSEADGPAEVDPIRDLIPLCSNCHSMAHRRKPPFTPDELRGLIAARPQS